MTLVFSNFPEPFSRNAVSHLEITSHNYKIKQNLLLKHLTKEATILSHLSLRFNIVFQVFFDGIITEQCKT